MKVHLRAVLILLALAPPLAAQAAESQAGLVPRTDFAGAPTLRFDFPGVQVGVAEYEEGPTGATVFYFPKGVKAAVDVRGGAPGTVATDFLRLAYESAFVDAITFAGGSSYGLSAATGAAQELNDRRRERGGWDEIATVPGAIIFDVGNRRFNTVVPDERLGRAALRAAQPGAFPLGARGAGRFAMQGGYYDSRGGMDRRQHSGQGGAFRQLGPTRVAVFTVVNALGAVVDRQGRVVRCSDDPAMRDCGTIAERLSETIRQRTGGADDVQRPTRNTTLTLVVTNQKLPFWALQRLAIQVHTSMARALQPFHTVRDGDVLFAVTTGEVENPELAPVELGVAASEVAWDAVLASVPPLPPRPRGSVRVNPRLLDAYTGEYRLGPEAVLAITREGNRLRVEATGERPVYGFGRKQQWELFPASETEWVSRNARGDWLRFERQGDRVTGLVLNPGTWGLPARKAR